MPGDYMAESKMKITFFIFALALGLLGGVIQWGWTLNKDRHVTMESRIEALEKFHMAPPGHCIQSYNSAMVTVELVRKELQRHATGLELFDIIFDVEFTGTEILEERHIRDIKGTLYFIDVFGDDVVGVPVIERLDIGSGDKKRVAGIMVDWRTVLESKEWRRVLNTHPTELQVRFLVDSVIYED